VVSIAACLCHAGKVTRLRLLGDTQHTTRIAFVEFAQAESALAALHCSGALLGGWPAPSRSPCAAAAGRAAAGAAAAAAAGAAAAAALPLLHKHVLQPCALVTRLPSCIRHCPTPPGSHGGCNTRPASRLAGSLPLRVSPSKTPVRGDKDDAEGGGGGGSFPA